MTQQLLDYIKSKLDQQQSMPLYLQLKQAIESAIEEKILTHGSVLPSERKMSDALDLSRVTVVNALNALLAEKLITKHQGKGTIINLPVSYSLSSGGFSSQLQHLGVISNRWLVREKLLANEQLALELEVPLGAYISKIKRVRLLDNRPIAIETMFIPEQFLLHPELLEGSLYGHWAQQGIHPDEQDYSLTVHIPSREDTRLLGLKDGTPLMKLVLKSRNTNHDVLEYGTVYCLSDYFHFDFKVRYWKPSV